MHAAQANHDPARLCAGCGHEWDRHVSFVRNTVAVPPDPFPRGGEWVRDGGSCLYSPGDDIVCGCSRFQDEPLCHRCCEPFGYCFCEGVGL